MKALRVQVERVVRPIRAHVRRKDRMREELLAHLTQLYDEELGRTGDAEAATAEAIRRFGDAPALTQELQASVPWVERWAFVSIPMGPWRRRVGETSLHYMLRCSAWQFALSTLCCVLIALVGIATRGHKPPKPDQATTTQAIVFLLGTFAVLGTVMVGQGLLCEGIRRGLERRAAVKATEHERRAIWKMIGEAATQSAVKLGQAELCEPIRQEMESHAATAIKAERRKTIRRIVIYLTASMALLGTFTIGMLFWIGMVIHFQFITHGQTWVVTLLAVFFALPLTFLHVWDTKSSNRRFENWESLDLSEQATT